MKSQRTLAIGLAVLGAVAALSQGQAPPALRSGPGVQAPQDAREPELLKTCKVPPPAPGGPVAGPAPANVAQASSRDYIVKEIPGVIVAGQQWKEIWKELGNNADGIIGASDGGLLVAQNDKSDVVKLDQNGRLSIAYVDTNTGGALSMSSRGVLFLNSKAFNPAIMELAPRHRTLANRYRGDPLDCIGALLNDLAADSKGGVYFTMGGLYYADPKGVVTKYGEDLRPNGIILSPDEKILYVTNGGTLAAFDVQKNGSLTNQREFAKLEAGGAGDGSTVDAIGRIYVSSNPGVQVMGSDGKYLGLIPTPRGIISLAFSGRDKKTLYAVAQYRDGVPTHNAAGIIAIQMTAQGYKGRAK